MIKWLNLFTLVDKVLVQLDSVGPLRHIDEYDREMESTEIRICRHHGDWTWKMNSLFFHVT